ncbi:uncharacterized protein LOC126876090 [Bombus huntii]|uniref:uncharacterized protein LOC126876060 n=1 Tax=Bombus huntii TaxID=85661 RepID=UPI0021AA8255|nr:uncharacterized protein LOC126876060 [Bombus huntii]XP_050494954.1 uncharacterized protein LOC126876090 [Bombus huntii]
MERLKTEAEDKWRVEWTFHNPYSWTKRLIEDPLIFYRTRRGVNYHVMQILTGHRIFNWYRHRIGKEMHTSCWDCGAAVDDAEHVLFWCPRWTGERAELEAEIGEECRIENRIVEKLAAEERLWLKFSNVCTTVMTNRLNKEREVEALRRRESRRRRV